MPLGLQHKAHLQPPPFSAQTGENNTVVTALTWGQSTPHHAQIQLRDLLCDVQTCIAHSAESTLTVHMETLLCCRQFVEVGSCREFYTVESKSFSTV